MQFNLLAAEICNTISNLNLPKISYCCFDPHIINDCAYIAPYPYDKNYTSFLFSYRIEVSSNKIYDRDMHAICSRDCIITPYFQICMLDIAMCARLKKIYFSCNSLDTKHYALNILRYFKQCISISIQHCFEHDSMLQISILMLDCFMRLRVR